MQRSVWNLRKEPTIYSVYSYTCIMDEWLCPDYRRGWTHTPFDFRFSGTDTELAMCPPISSLSSSRRPSQSLDSKIVLWGTCAEWRCATSKPAHKALV